MAVAKAPCARCLQETTHKVHYSTEKREVEEENPVVDIYRLLECAGCGAISMEHRWFVDGAGKRDIKSTYYPSPVSRRKPEWLQSWALGVHLWPDEHDEKLSLLFDLIDEIYEAVNAGQHRLATMGIRSLLETIMIAKVGDQGCFRANLQGFRDQGYISAVQYDGMSAVLDAGHATTHRLFKPSPSELSAALDIAEGVFGAIYIQSEQALQLSDRIPARPPKPTRKSGA